MTTINNIEAENNNAKVSIVNKAKASKKTANQNGGLHVRGGASMETILALLKLQQSLLLAMLEYSKFTKDSYNFQMELAQAAGDNIKQAAITQGSAQIAGGATMLGMSVAGGAISTIGGNKAQKEMQPEIDAVNSELQPIKSNMEALQKPVAPEVIQGNKVLKTEEMNQLKGKIENNRDTYAGKGGKSEWLDENGNLKPEYDVRLADKFSETKKPFRELKTAMEEHKRALETKENTIQSEINKKAQNYNTIAQTLTGTSQALNGVINGGATIAKGNNDLLAQVDQGASQQQGNIASQNAQAREQNNQAANNVEQIENQVKRSEELKA